jgi:hypothetical protein
MTPAQCDVAFPVLATGSRRCAANAAKFIIVMATTKTSFRFTAPLAPVKVMFMNAVIFLPAAVVRRLPKGRIRVKGTFNGAPFALAVQHMKDGSHFFSVSASLRKAARIKIGDAVKVSFRLVDPDKVDVPEELREVLKQDVDAKQAWENLTPGYQRSLIIFVTSVKNVDKRIERSLKLLERAKAGLLPGAKRK